MFDYYSTNSQLKYIPCGFWFRLLNFCFIHVSQLSYVIQSAICNLYICFLLCNISTCVGFKVYAVIHTLSRLIFYLYLNVIIMMQVLLLLCHVHVHYCVFEFFLAQQYTFTIDNHLCSHGFILSITVLV